MNHEYAAQDCLAPNVLRVYDRPRPQPFMLRNTSVILKWMPLNLEEHCEDVVVSFPPVIYGITVKYFERPIPGFPIVSHSDFTCVHYVYCYIYIVHV